MGRGWWGELGDTGTERLTITLDHVAAAVADVPKELWTEQVSDTQAAVSRPRARSVAFPLPPPHPIPPHVAPLSSLAVAPNSAAEQLGSPDRYRRRKDVQAHAHPRSPRPHTVISLRPLRELGPRGHIS